jgi:5-methylcytosine-specific restriction endonuclease McrA
MPYPSNWDTIRRQVYKRDDYTCQNCGAQGGPRGPAELHAHHIVDAHSGGNIISVSIRLTCRTCMEQVLFYLLVGMLSTTAVWGSFQGNRHLFSH